LRIADQFDFASCLVHALILSNRAHMSKPFAPIFSKAAC
jgi:hypothetical protein